MPIETQNKIENIKTESQIIADSIPAMARGIPAVVKANDLMQSLIELAEKQNTVIDELMTAIEK